MSSSPSTPRNGRIRPRPVSFGNPALGTYGGCVYTLEEAKNGSLGSTQDEFCVPKGATTDNDKLVAMVNVPPEQVPEGILNFCRSHRRFIDLLRIVIASPEKHGDISDAQIAPTPAVAVGSNSATASVTEGCESSPKEPTSDLTTSLGDLVLRDTGADQHDVKEQKEMPSRSYIVLLELSTKQAAESFVRDLNGKAFSSLEPDVTCSVYHVVALKGEDGVSLISPFFAPSTLNNRSSPIPSNHEVQPDNADTNANNRSRPCHSPLTTSHEVQNCAVCLERLDQSSVTGQKPSSSILTTVCNHSFHLECLLQWQDSPCPVCRYDHSGLNEALSQCHVCGTTEQNYVCLICGVVSCGGRSMVVENPDNTTSGAGEASQSMSSASTSNILSHGHAGQHYNETLHAYALDTETQHVWDFVGQGYVHRLLQSKDDKLVETADPNNTSSYERTLSPGLSDAQEDEVVHRKLEGFASQYYTLLKSQLEQQRIYYEGCLEEIRREYDDRGSGRRHNNNKKKVVSASAELISALKQERNQLGQRCDTLKRRYAKVSEDLAFLKNTTESLEANKEPLRHEIAEAQRQRAETLDMIHNCIPLLEEKVAKLMMELDESIVSEETAPDNRKNEGRKLFRGSDKKPAAKR